MSCDCVSDGWRGGRAALASGPADAGTRLDRIVFVMLWRIVWLIFQSPSTQSDIRAGQHNSERVIEASYVSYDANRRHDDRRVEA